MEYLKKKWNMAVWAVFLMLGSYIVFRGTCMIVTEGSSHRFLQQIGNAISVQAVKTLAPALTYPFYAKEETDDLFMGLWNQVPIYRYVNESVNYETEIEDKTAYDLILAGEANDEHAVDEEGELIVPEEMKDSIADEQEEMVQSITEQETPVQSIDYEMLNNADYVLGAYYNVENSTMLAEGQLDAIEFLSKDMSLNQEVQGPKVLIYHTHSQEEFTDSVPGDANTTIVGVGAYLAEVLQSRYGIGVVHNKTVYDMVDGRLDRNQAYSLAEKDLPKILEANPSVEVVIDLHRDGLLDTSKHIVVDVNGKPTAPFMFVNGLSRTKKVGDIDYLKNPYIQDNMAFSFQMQLKAAEYYPNVTRKILLKGYRYNLHLKPKAALVEVGFQTNTLQEEKNAMEPLAHIIAMTLNKQ